MTKHLDQLSRSSEQLSHYQDQSVTLNAESLEYAARTKAKIKTLFRGLSSESTIKFDSLMLLLETHNVKLSG